MTTQSNTWTSPQVKTAVQLGLALAVLGALIGSYALLTGASIAEITRWRYLLAAYTASGAAVFLYAVLHYPFSPQHRFIKYATVVNPGLTLVCTSLMLLMWNSAIGIVIGALGILSCWLVSAVLFFVGARRQTT